VKTQSQTEIDATLHSLGGVQPPSGLERRVHARLETPRRRPRIHFASAATLAAGIAFSTFALSPALRESVLRVRPGSSPSLLSQPAAGLIAHPAGDFGAAAAVRVPTTPIPVAPTPAGQGRGHARSNQPVHTVYPTGPRTSLSHRVAVPPANRPDISASTPLARTPSHSAPNNP
jgi:hypothetical protein